MRSVLVARSRSDKPPTLLQLNHLLPFSIMRLIRTTGGRRPTMMFFSRLACWRWETSAEINHCKASAHVRKVLSLVLPLSREHAGIQCEEVRKGRCNVCVSVCHALKFTRGPVSGRLITVCQPDSSTSSESAGNNNNRSYKRGVGHT